jgi:iron complex outermembrane receptor protein
MNTSQAQNEGPIEEIITTGTRIVRTDMYEEAGHVIAMDELSIDAMAELNISDVLRSSPLNSHGSFQERSGNAAQSNAFIDLRGLGPERTLVIVDGMRIPGSPNEAAAAVNINMLPTVAVKRVDILADGASAVYGSDAMAGVANLVLHRDFEGLEVSMRMGDRSEDDGGDRSFGLLAGVNGDRGNVVLAMEYSHRDPIFDRDRHYTSPQVEDFDGDGEIHIYNDTVGVSYYGRTWEVFDPVTGYYELRAAADCPETGGFKGVMGAGAFGLWDQAVCAYAFAEISAGRAELEKMNGYMYGSFDLTDRAQLYTRALITKNESFGRYAPPAAPWPDPPADHAHNPFDLEQMIADGLISDQALLWGYYRWTNVGPRDADVSDFQWDFAAGVKGDISDGISFDFYAQTGQYDSVEFGNYFLSFLGLDYVLRNDIDPFSELGTGAMRAQTTLDNFTTQSRLYGHMQIDAWDVFGAGESIALIGAEYVEFDYEFKIDSLSEAGFVGGSSGLSNSGLRDISTIFVEYLLPVTESTEISLAGRYDNYSDFGGTFTPSIGFVSHITDRFLVRARWGEGFVAPNMSMLYGPSSEFRQVPYDPVTDSDRPVQIYYNSNPDLEPETSTSLSAGFNWEYLEDHSVDLTYYKINVDNVIVWPDAQDLLWADAAGTTWDPEGTRVERVGGFVRNIYSIGTNADKLEASGLDLQMHSMFDTRAGIFDLRAFYSYQLSYKQNAFYQGSYQDIRGFQDAPDTRAQASIMWLLGDHAVDLVMNYIGPHAASEDQDYATGVLTAGEEDYSSWTTANLSYAFDAGDWGRIRIGANNITNRDPVLDPTTDVPATSYLYDYTGRVIFLDYRKSFD